MDLNLLVIHFSVASQEQSTKSTAEEFPKGCKGFFLGKLLYGAPGQVTGHSNDKLDLQIIEFPDSIMNNGFSFDIDICWRKTC